MYNDIIRKANPTPSDVHVDGLLTNVLIAWMQRAENFVVGQIFPALPVQKQTDILPQYTRADFYRNQMRKRARGMPGRRADFRTDNTLTYTCDVWNLSKPIDDQERANEQAPYQLERDATRFLGQQVSISTTAEWVTQFWTTGVWTNDQTGVAGTPGADQFRQWNDSASTPIDDVHTQFIDMWQTTGFIPNVFAVTPSVHKALIGHANVKDLYKHTTAGGPTSVDNSALARLFLMGFPGRYVVLGSVENTGEELGTESTDFAAGDAAALFYAAPAPGLYQPTAGYTVAWTGYAGANAMGGRVRRYRDEEAHSFVVETEWAGVPLKVSADLGRYFASAVA